MQLEGTIFLFSCTGGETGKMELMCRRVMLLLYASMEKKQQAVLYGAVMSRKKMDAEVFQIDMTASSPQS